MNYVEGEKKGSVWEGGMGLKKGILNRHYREDEVLGGYSEE